MSNKLYPGADIILKSLEMEKVKVVFGYPGGSVLPLYDSLYHNDNIKHILTRHEQGAGHAADGYARSTGNTGVVFATSGPGATNLVTAIATAQMDSIPMVVITGQVLRRYLGKQAFQEAEIVDIVKPVTKHAVIVQRVEDLAKEIKKAFKIANTGRKGSVLIDIPKDVMIDKCQFMYPLEAQFKAERRGESENRYQQVAGVLKKAKRPLIFVGGGAKDAVDEVKELAEKLKAPVIYSLMGKGVLDDNHPLNIGMVGMHGTGAANYAVHHCDLLFAIGVRFDDRQTGDENFFAKGAKIVHLDIDRKEFSKNIRAHVSLHDDSALGLFKLLRVMKRDDFEPQNPWIDQISEWQHNHPLTFESEGSIKPQEILNAINIITKGTAVMTTDVGQHQMWAAQYFKTSDPKKFITSGGLGTMGFGLPASMGAQLGNPKTLTIAFAGDGSIQMNSQELMTISACKLPIKIALVNNKSLGMVRQWQKLFYEERYSHTLFADEAQPDFMTLARAYGIPGVQITERERLVEDLETAFELKGPCFIEIVADSEANVYPMVPTGASNDKMIFGE